MRAASLVGPVEVPPPAVGKEAVLGAEEVRGPLSRDPFSRDPPTEVDTLLLGSSGARDEGGPTIAGGSRAAGGRNSNRRGGGGTGDGLRWARPRVGRCAKSGRVTRIEGGACESAAVTPDLAVGLQKQHACMWTGQQQRRGFGSTVSNRCAGGSGEKRRSSKCGRGLRVPR